MSFRLFIYYCALCGGIAAFFGWVLTRRVDLESSQVATAGLQGMCLGLLIAFGLGLVDALWSASRQLVVIAARVFIAVVVGCLGGLLGGVIGQSLYRWTPLAVFLVFGWTITGLLIGVSLGVFDILVCLIRQEDARGALRKLINGVVGGTVGGLLGGTLYALVKMFLEKAFQGTPDLWFPSAIGFVVLGLCIGLLIGLAQVILKEAWLKVERGFRAGRELLLERPEITIGRAEGCDIGLFGDPQVEKLHARIRHQGADYIFSTEGQSKAWVNDQRLDGPRKLETGDLIRVGNCYLRFGERQKKQ